MTSSPSVYRIVGIDPGTDTLGIAVLDVDVQSRSVEIVRLYTLHASRNVDPLSAASVFRGSRYAQIQYLEKAMSSLFVNLMPSAIVHESPFMGRFPEAYRALAECIGAIRRACDQYNPTLLIESVDPPTAKLAVGAKVGRDSTKDTVKQAVLAMQLPCSNVVDLSLASEHAIDAIAVAYWKAKKLIAGL
jgi:Holliday junction resolvasome RuvABC endonuclease subunit